MKVLVLLSIVLLSLPCRGETPGPFASSDRIVTVVQSHHGPNPHWTVWAVRPGRIVIYAQSGRSGVSDELLGDVAITSEQEATLRQAVAKISPGSKGRIWFSPDVHDGVSLSIHFAPDGSRRDDDIALDNLWRPEFRELCTSVSSVSPPKLKITFEEIVGSRADQHRLAVVSRSIKEYRAPSQPKKEPWWKFWK
jgi:hypothetical protein